MSAGDWKEMYQAAQDGNLELLKYHIQNGVNPNYQHPEILSTPLVASLIAGHDDVALFLLAHGADPKLRSDFDDLTPLEAARKHKRIQIMEKLSDLIAPPERANWLQKVQNKISSLFR